MVDISNPFDDYDFAMVRYIGAITLDTDAPKPIVISPPKLVVVLKPEHGGGAYAYEGVPKEVEGALAKAAGVGTAAAFFKTQIEAVYPRTKVA